MRRQESFPWIIVMGGAVLYWTIALGIGIPSLYRLLGPPGPAHRAAAVEARCVQAVAVDGTPIVFGDCFNVRFVPDSPELPRPHHTLFGYHRGMSPEGLGPEMVSTPKVSPDMLSTPEWTETPVEPDLHDAEQSEADETDQHDPQQPEASDSVGRTAY